MQAGSLVECIKDFNRLSDVLRAFAFGEDPPEKGQIYTVINVVRCQCGQHDNVELEERELFYDANHFREVQPPLIIEDLYTEPETVPLVRELEPELV